MDRPKISVVIPTFNNEGTINDALESIINQSYKNLEIIIVDGNSSDKTVSKAKKCQKADPRIKIIAEEDEGIYDAMNKGIDKSTGDWLYFIGADDKLINDKIIEELYKLEAFKYDKVIYGNVIIKGDTIWAKDDEKYDGPFDTEKLLFKNICQQAIFYPRSIVDDIGYFNKDYSITADWDYNLRCFSKYEFQYIDKVIALFNSGGKSTQFMIDVGFKEFARNIISYFKINIEKELKNKESLFYNFLKYYKYLLRTQLNPFSEKIDNGISIVTAVSNSTGLCEKAISSWINQEAVDEVIILVWNSDHNIHPIIEKFKNGKLLLAQVNSNEKWNSANANNLVLRIASKDKILKVNENTKLSSDFFKNNKLTPGIFYTADTDNIKNFNEINLVENAFFYRNDFFKVSGYMDFLRSYGWEDSDLYERFETEGLERLSFKTNSIKTLNSNNNKGKYPQPEILKLIPGKELDRLKILLNKHLQDNDLKWFSRIIMPEFSIRVINDNIIECRQIDKTESNKIQGPFKEFEIRAINERFREIGIDMPEELNKLLNNEELIQLYNLYITKDSFLPYNHIFSLINKIRNVYNVIINRKNDEINDQLTENRERDKSLRLKDKTISERDQLIELKEKNILAKNLTIEKKDKIILDKDNLIKTKDVILLEKDQIIKRLGEDIKQKDIIIKNKENIVKSRDNEIIEINKKIIQKDNEINEQREDIREKNEIIEQNDSQISSYKQQLEDFKTHIEILRNSLSWKIGRFITMVIAKIFFFITFNKKK